MDKWLARFWNKVSVRGEEDCWFWTGGLDKDGYGDVCRRTTRALAFRAIRENRAHRVAYTLKFGPIPKGVLITHSCDNPPCVNPGHLTQGTHQDNQEEKAERGRGKGVNRGSLNNNARLTASQVLEIRHLHTLGIPRGVIARRMRVTPSNITLIVSRKSWGWL